MAFKYIRKWQQSIAQSSVDLQNTFTLRKVRLKIGKNNVVIKKKR